MRVWKFSLLVVDRQTIWMPTDAQILTVQTQRDELQLWALCDEREPGTEAHEIVICGTGNPVPAAPGEYLGTFQTDGALVWHVFDTTASSSRFRKFETPLQVIESIRRGEGDDEFVANLSPRRRRILARDGDEELS